MRIRFVLTGIFLAIVACSSDSTGPKTTSLHELALAPNDNQADGVVRGVIRGMRLLNPSDSTSYERVANASIAVYLEFTKLPADSASETPKHQLLGTITSDNLGAFELTNVPTGWYSLNVTPPAGSPYESGTSGTIAFTSHTQETAVVWLYLK